MRIELATTVDESSRPSGIGLTALVICVFAVVSFGGSFFPLETSSNANFSSEYLPSFVSGIFLFCVELLTAWNYWKGKDWARTLVLIVSFLIVAREVSRIIDHDGGLVLVMSRPVFFLRFAAAIFLLYWLNTRPVRAWFKNAPPTAADLISDHLAGRLCTTIDHNSTDPNSGWRLAFEHDAELILTCPWRIALDDNLAYASKSAAGVAEDEDQPRQLLQNLRVKTVRVTPHTSDLFITFEMGIELQTWSVDRLSQQWKFSDPALTVVADSVGLNSQAIVESNLTKDSTAND